MLDAAIFEGAAALRRQLHRIPEIAGNEFKTQAAIREYISDLPLEVYNKSSRTAAGTG